MNLNDVIATSVNVLAEVNKQNVSFMNYETCRFMGISKF